MHITPRHIEQIAALHLYGSFCRAAEKLCISQPALSRSILVLEDKLGIKFFDRVRGRLELTPYGQIVLNRGQSILQEFELLRRDISMLHGGEQGVLHVGCGPIPSETLAGDAIALFNNRYPHITVKLTIDHFQNLVKLLENRVIDFFVGEADHLTGNDIFSIMAMPQQQGYFCCRRGHPLTQSASVTFNDILRYPMAVMRISERIYALLSKLSGTVITTLDDLPVGHIQCDNMNVLLNIVSKSDAVSMTSREIVAGSVFKDDIELLPLHVPQLKSGYSIVSLKAYSDVPAITCLKEHFLAAASQKIQAD